MLFQTATDSSGTGATNIGTYNAGGPLNDANDGNGDNTESDKIAYTFPSAGTYYMRACAGTANNTSFPVFESDTTNNCGAWTQIVVSGAPVVVSCTPSPSTQTTNTNVTWTATYSGFTQAPNRFTWTVTGGSPSSGSSATFTSKFAAAGNYAPTLTAKNSTTGQTTSNTSCTPVQIGGACGATPSPTITSSASRVTAGGTVTLHWSATNVNTSCVVSGPNIIGGTKTSNASSCSVSDGGGATATVNTQSTYCIVCDGNAAAQQCVTVDVTPKIIEF